MNVAEPFSISAFNFISDKWP